MQARTRTHARTRIYTYLYEAASLRVAHERGADVLRHHLRSAQGGRAQEGVGRRGRPVRVPVRGWGRGAGEGAHQGGSQPEGKAQAEQGGLAVAQGSGMSSDSTRSPPHACEATASSSHPGRLVPPPLPPRPPPHAPTRCTPFASCHTHLQQLVEVIAHKHRPLLLLKDLCNQAQAREVGKMRELWGRVAGGWSCPGTIHTAPCTASRPGQPPSVDVLPTPPAPTAAGALAPWYRHSSSARRARAPVARRQHGAGGVGHKSARAARLHAGRKARLRKGEPHSACSHCQSTLAAGAPKSHACTFASDTPAPQSLARKCRRRSSLLLSPLARSVRVVWLARVRERPRSAQARRAALPARTAPSGQ